MTLTVVLFIHVCLVGIFVHIFSGWSLEKK